MINNVTVVESAGNIIKEMERMGVHRTGVEIMGPKAQFRVVKIKDVPVVSANIIKQDMLSFGGEAATSRGTIDHSVRSSDVLIFGTVQQIEGLISKLKLQYFGLKQIAADIEEALDNYAGVPSAIRIGGKTFRFGERTYIMGILNVTPDSFSDGGMFFSASIAVSRAKKMLSEGADIIDIGGESTRPGARPVSVKEELKRVIPVIEAVSSMNGAVVSIDTTKSQVAEAAIKAGARMINDISALRFDSKMAKLAARKKVPVVLMHILGKPRTMQKNPRYKDLMADIISYLQKSISLAIREGVLKRNLIVDPGFGFGKTPEHNLEILRSLRQLRVLGQPVLIGTSRKSTIGSILQAPADQRLEGTAATVTAAIAAGADIVRVHDVGAMKNVAKVSDAIYRQPEGK